MDSSNQIPPNAIDTTSTRLLRRVAADDSSAWNQFVRIYGPVVRFWILGAGVSRSDMPDVFSDVFLAVLQNIDTFERQEGKAKFRAWLKQVSINKAKDHFRKLGKQAVAAGGTTVLVNLGRIEDGSSRSDEEDPALQTSEQTFIVQRTLQMVRKEFREKTWLAFQRTAIDGQTATQVAEELDMTALTVRKAKSRVLQRLKAELQHLLDLPDTSSGGE